MDHVNFYLILILFGVIIGGFSAAAVLKSFVQPPTDYVPQRFYPPYQGYYRTNNGFFSSLILVLMIIIIAIIAISTLNGNNLKEPRSGPVLELTSEKNTIDTVMKMDAIPSTTYFEPNEFYLELDAFDDLHTAQQTAESWLTNSEHTLLLAYNEAAQFPHVLLLGPFQTSNAAKYYATQHHIDAKPIALHNYTLN